MAALVVVAGVLAYSKPPPVSGYVAPTPAKVSYLNKVDHVTYACRKGQALKWAWYHLEVEGGTLISRIDDVRPDDKDSSMLIWCIDHGSFGTVLIEGIDRERQSQVSAFAESHSDAKLPGGAAHLVLVGPGWVEAAASGAAPELNASIARGHVSALGAVNDSSLQALMQQMMVFAAPAFNITGVASKNVAALAAGVPLVTTPDGLRGLGVPPVQQALVPVASDASSFARLALALQRQPWLHRRAQRRGLEHAKRYFDPHVQHENLATILEPRPSTSASYEVQSIDGVDRPSKALESSVRSSEALTPRALLKLAGARWAQTDADANQAERAREVLRCPLRSSSADDRSATNVTATLLSLHARLVNSGYRVMPNTHSDWPRLSPMVFESGDWPKPAGCAARLVQGEEAALEPEVHARRRLVKHVNHQRQAELLQVWKGGSSMLGTLLNCLQPGEWTEVPQLTPRQPGHTLHALVRDPLERFASVVHELVRRTIFAECPRGPCTAERDGFHLAAVRTQARERTNWFAAALQMLSRQPASRSTTGGRVATSNTNDEREADLRAVLSAAVNDSECGLRYYASDHALSQVAQLMQASSSYPWLGISDDDVVQYHKIEELQTAESMHASSLISAIGADGASPERMTSCLAQSQEGANFSHHTSVADGSALSAEEASALRWEQMPSSAEIFATLKADPALQARLCAIYAQDLLCLPYKPPPACEALLMAQTQSMQPPRAHARPRAVHAATDLASIRSAAANNLLQRLHVQSSASAPRSFLFGHHRSTEVGAGWRDNSAPLMRSDVLDVVGHYPSVLGWDLSQLTEEDEGSHIGATALRWHASRFANAGGVNTYSWHMRNPFSEDDGYRGVVNMSRLLPGGDSHTQLRSSLDAAAEYLRSLPAKVPVLFRPYHEMNGKWFWWGTGKCTPSEYVALWRFTAQHLRVTHGLTNVLLVFSPSALSPATTTSYLAHYPGDDVVDVFGLDAYEKPAGEGEESREVWPESLIAHVRVVARLAAARAKPWAISETGPRKGLQGVLANTSRWWTHRLLRPLQTFYATEGAMLPSPAYVMAWANFNSTYFFVPYRGYSDAYALEDFVEFASDPWVNLLPRINSTMTPASRPLVVLKSERTGSTWLGDTLGSLGLWRTAVKEVGNTLFEELKDSEQLDTYCQRLAAEVLSALYDGADLSSGVGYGMVTYNPNKFSDAIPSVKCHTALLKTLGQVQPQPLIVALTRRNHVAQAASSLSAKALKDAYPSCASPFHADDPGSHCPRNVTFHIEPSALLAHAHELETGASRVRKMALKLAAGSKVTPLHLTYESMLAAGNGESLALPAELVRFIGQPELPSKGPRLPKASTDSPAPGTQAVIPRPAVAIANLDECRAYFELHARTLLSQLLEPPFDRATAERQVPYVSGLAQLSPPSTQGETMFPSLPIEFTSGDERSCQLPSSGGVVALGSHHKTGTELSMQLLSVMTNDTWLFPHDDSSATEDQSDDHCNGRSNSGDEAVSSCMERAAWAPYERAVFFSHINMTTAERSSHANDDNGGGKLVHWVRDPLDIILSGYFYHRKASEKWLRASESRDVAKLQSVCKEDEQRLHGHRGGLLQLPCESLDQLSSGPEWIRLVQRGGVSYQRLLNLMPLEAGLLTEAHRAMPTIVAMSATSHALDAARPGFALTVDLDEAREDCTRAFGKMFSFLEVESTRAPRCVELGCLLINGSAWRSQEVGHSTLLDVDAKERARLRAWLQRQPYIAAHVAPIRASIGYYR